MAGKVRAGGRPGRVDPRGNSYSRKRRKERMLSDPQFEHDPTHPMPNVNCVHCGTMLTFDTVEADRREPGGSYKYSNIQPACRTCNLRRSNNSSWNPPVTEREGSLA